MTSDISPGALAEIVEPLVGDAVLAFDVDGVLAPLVGHADDARLSPGVGESLTRLAERSQVVIVSGRSLADLERLFGFAASIAVIGSHGLERRGHEPLTLSDDEQFTFDQLETLGTRAVDAAGEGAWLEYKPASLVVHVRSADRGLGQAALDAVSRLGSMVAGAQVKHGHSVVELLARSTSKGEVIAGLRRPDQPVVFVGDDVTDESVFEIMGDGDVSVRVGAGDTAAHHRLPDPESVAEFLAQL